MSGLESESALTCKVVLVGESGVGKTSIISKYIHKLFNSVRLATTGASFSTKVVELGDKSIKFEIWDTAGQERFRSLAKVFYKNASVCILVYDITRKDSFNEIKKYWLNQIKENAPPNISIYLFNIFSVLGVVGNKSDMYEFEDVPEKEAKSFADSNNAFFQTASAKNDDLNELFNLIAKKFLILNGQYDDGNRNKRSKTERLKKNNTGEKKKGCC